MAEVFELEAPDPAAIARAADAIRRGELVVLPTDTVYGVGTRPDLREATGRVFEVKRRPRDLTLPILVGSAAAAETVATMDERARRLAERFWPGGLTLVLPRSETAGGWDLGEERATVGVRVPAHEVALALLERTGPLAVTSANRSGEPTPPDCDGVVDALGDGVAVYLCAGRLAGGVASTVVDLTSAEAHVLREGALAARDVLAALG